MYYNNGINIAEDIIHGIKNKKKNPKRRKKKKLEKNQGSIKASIMSLYILTSSFFHLEHLHTYKYISSLNLFLVFFVLVLPYLDVVYYIYTHPTYTNSPPFYEHI